MDSSIAFKNHLWVRALLASGFAIALAGCGAASLKPAVPQAASRLIATESNANIVSAVPEAFLVELSARTPSALLELGGSYEEVGWDSVSGAISDRDRYELLCREKGASHGLARVQGTILLHRVLKEIVSQGLGADQPLPCNAHLSAYRLAQAAIIHQLGHEYYRRTIAKRDQKPWIKTPRPSPEWVRADTFRSPEPLEGENEEERFASNLEYLVLDPAFSCHRPFEARWIGDELADRAIQSRVRACAPDWNVTAEDGTRVSLDPSRIREIRYAYVEKGKRPSHRATSAFFLIRGESGEFGLSLRAHLSDPVADALSSLTGRRQSRLYVYPWQKLREEYTRVRLEEVVSAPLRLSEAEKERFLSLALERFWAGGNYYVENRQDIAFDARDFLREALGPARGGSALYASRPEHFFENLAKLKLTDVDQAQRSPAERKGLEEAYSRLSGFFPAQWKSFDEFAEKSLARERKLWAERIVDAAARSGRPAPLPDLSELENWLLVRVERRSSELAAKDLSRTIGRERSPEARHALKLIGYLRAQNHHHRPSERIVEMLGYGVPLKTDGAERGLASEDPEIQSGVGAALESLKAHRRSVSRALGEEQRGSAANLEFLRAKSQ